MGSRRLDLRTVLLQITNFLIEELAWLAVTLILVRIYFPSFCLWKQPLWSSRPAGPSHCLPCAYRSFAGRSKHTTVSRVPERILAGLHSIARVRPSYHCILCILPVLQKVGLKCRARSGRKYEVSQVLRLLACAVLLAPKREPI